MNANRMKFFMGSGVAALLLFALPSCRSIPENAVVVKPFDRQRYLGRWYEIARLDFKHERNLNNTTATYALNDDGSIRVVNRGYNYVTGEWKQATGKAKAAGAADEGRLKVSFFGPFYSGYNVLALDRDYNYALVAGKNLKYLWLLSRSKTMPDSIRKAYLDQAARLGYKVADLVWVVHDKNE
ncbi:lipocalin family protein [Paraflavisolibacter sp. H34]|uniref:lipocalin family protein n=1 Tax=Huijunlia imazamoxiresistens TaxID=3127457 RepID=UPI0030166F59